MTTKVEERHTEIREGYHRYMMTAPIKSLTVLELQYVLEKKKDLMRRLVGAFYRGVLREEIAEIHIMINRKGG